MAFEYSGYFSCMPLHGARKRQEKQNKTEKFQYTSIDE